MFKPSDKIFRVTVYVSVSGDDWNSTGDNVELAN